MERREELNEIFKDTDENEKKLIQPLLDEIIFLEKQMADLRQMTFIEVHPKNAAKQRKTEAAKLYKECSQSYMNAIRILSSLLHKEDSGEDSPLRQYLREFRSKYE